MSIEAMKLALFALDIVKIHYTQNRHINEAIAAVKEALAQPEQEPVQYKCTVIDDQHPNGIPLEQWVKPPQRTEPPQKKVWTFWDLSGSDITDAIKAKLKEKNNG